MLYLILSHLHHVHTMVPLISFLPKCSAHLLTAFTNGVRSDPDMNPRNKAQQLEVLSQPDAVSITRRACGLRAIRQ